MQRVGSSGRYRDAGLIQGLHRARRAIIQRPIVQAFPFDAGRRSPEPLGCLGLWLGLYRRCDGAGLWLGNDNRGRWRDHLFSLLDAFPGFPFLDAFPSEHFLNAISKPRAHPQQRNHETAGQQDGENPPRHLPKVEYDAEERYATAQNPLERLHEPPHNSFRPPRTNVALGFSAKSGCERTVALLLISIPTIMHRHNADVNGATALTCGVST